MCCESKEFAVVALRCSASSSGTTSRSKKTLRAAEQQRADVARARRRWMRAQGMFDPAHLVFLDETAANTKMMRVGGRCPARREVDRPGSARPLENYNLRRRFPLQGNDSAICN